MKLRVSDDLPAPVIEQLRQDLAPLLPIALDVTSNFRKGYLPTQVRLIGERSEWMESLKGPAMTLLAQLSAEGALGSSSDKARIGKALADPSVEPLKQIAQTLCGILRGGSQKNFKVGVGLAVPNWQHGTTLSLENPEEELTALAIARFVNQLTDVEVAIREEMKGPRKPHGGVHLEVSLNGPLVLRWLDERTLNYHEREVTPPDAPEAAK
jgi:hypothetical protein